MLFILTVFSLRSSRTIILTQTSQDLSCSTELPRQTLKLRPLLSSLNINHKLCLQRFDL